MKKKIFLFITVFWLGPLIHEVYGQTELKNLINYALEHSRAVKKADFQVEEGNFIRKEAVGYGLPQIEGSASYSKMMFEKIDIDSSIYKMVSSDYYPILDQLGSIDNFNSASAGVQVTQLIYSQAYWVGLRTAKKTQELYSILKNKSEEDVIAEVANAYYQTGSLMLQKKTLDKSIQNLKELSRIAELNFKNDLIKETEVSRLKVTITNLEVTHTTIQNGIQVQLSYLKALAGMPLDSVIQIDTASIIHNLDAKQMGREFTVENVPSYQALIKQYEVYEMQTKLSKAEYFPTLAAFGQFNYSSYSTSSSFDTWNNMNTIGLNLTVPIFTSGVTNAKVKQSLLKQKQLNEDILQTKDFLKVDYDNAFSDYQTSQKLLLVQRDNRELAQRVYNQTLQQYQEGMASLADLLNVNSDFLSADNSYNQQILKCKTSEIKMLKASGNLKLILNK